MTGSVTIANTAERITAEHLRDQCATALDRRRESYPAMIASGSIDEDAAARDIEGWQMLFLEWTWNCLPRADGQRAMPYALGISDAARALTLDAVDLSLRRIRSELSRLGGGGAQRPELLRQEDVIGTLRMHLDAAPNSQNRSPERKAA